MIIPEEAGTGIEVLKAVKDRDYEVLLLALALSQVNGFEVIKQV